MNQQGVTTQFEKSFPVCAYPSLLRETAERFPDKLGIIFQDRAYTFRELDEKSNQVARGLAALSVKKGDRVLISLFTTPEYLFYFYGILKLGAIVVPMNPSYKLGDARGVFLDAEPKVAFVSQSVYEHLKPMFRSNITKQVLVQGESIPEGCLAAESFVRDFSREPVDLLSLDPREVIAFLPYTSGTTGKPKGAMLTHENLVSGHYQYIMAGKISERDTSLIFVPATHVYGTTLMGGAVTAGATQVLMERYNLETSLQLVEKYRVTIYYGTTSVFVEMANFLRLKEYDLSSLRYLNSGGSPLPQEVIERVQAASGKKIANGYGMTEAPISGTRVPGEDRKIADLETGEVLREPDKLGEVVIRGPQVMKGYWRDPELTAQVLRNGWLYTGDIGIIDSQGKLSIIARKKEIIKYKGFAIAPSEIEGVLLEYPSVTDCAVIGIPHAEVGEVPKAFVVCKKDSNPDKQEILDFVASKVAGYKKIHELVFVESLPRNEQGKILKRLLK